MRNAWNEILTFLRITGQGGAYGYLGFAAALFLLIMGKQRDGSRRAAVGFCITALLFCNPLIAAFYVRITGNNYPLWKVTLAIPLLPFLAYAGTVLTDCLCEGKEKIYRYAVGAGLILVIMMSGTIMPWSAREELRTTGDAADCGEERMMEQISEAASGMIARGDGPLLVAPKGIMNSIRRYDSRIQLIYGRNLWQTGALDYLHETYTDGVILLCQKMESTGENTAETVEMALELGCNLIVCREKLSDAFITENGLLLYAQEDGLYLYIR